MTENIQNKRKLWKDVKVGDTIYVVKFHQASTKIYKREVLEVKNFGTESIRIEAVDCWRFYAYKDDSSYH